jgi:outer membrane protein assembly factor BamB
MTAQMLGRHAWFVCWLWLACSVSAQAPAPSWIGYGGPVGARVYPAAKPPTKDFKVAWTTPLPGWGHGQPVAVAGKVFVLCETGPQNVFPLLVCVDGATGKILWQREVDHLTAVPGGNAPALRKELKAWFDREAELIVAYVQSGHAKEKQPEWQDKDHEAALKRLYGTMGLMRDKFRRGPYCAGYECFGDAFAAPVSDGQFVYVATLWGGFACFDLAGKQQWVAYARGNRWTFCNVGRSPILHGNLLLSNQGGTMRAFDRRTGKLLWSREDPPAAYSMVTPAVIRVAGKDVLLAAGPSAYLLPEGKPLKVTGWVSEGQQILVKSDEPDVAFFCGAGEHAGWLNKGDTEIQPPAAFRFSLAGDTLTVKLLWHGGDLGGKAAWGDNTPWMVCHAGKFYHRGGPILDALTGKILAGSFQRFQGVVPRTRHLLLIAGGHIYGLADGDKEPVATLSVATLDGTSVASTTVRRAEPTPAQRAAHTYATGNPRVWLDGPKPRFGYSQAFTFGDNRIYIRSLDSLIALE